MEWGRITIQRRRAEWTFQRELLIWGKWPRFSRWVNRVWWPPHLSRFQERDGDDWGMARRAREARTCDRIDEIFAAIGIRGTTDPAGSTACFLFRE